MEVKDYLKLPYTWVTRLIEDESGKYYLSKCVELENCFTTADTYNELEAMQKDVLEGYISVLFEKGMEIPLPSQKNLLSYH